MQLKIAQVIPIKKTPPGVDFFDYLIPDTLAKVVHPGVLVEIPFRRQTILGVVARVATTSVIIKLKEISGVRNTVPLMSAEELAFLEWFSKYYNYSLPSTLRLSLPPELKRQVKLKAPIIDSGLLVGPKISRPAISLATKVLSGRDHKYFILENSYVARVTLLRALIDQAVAQSKKLLIISPHVDFLNYLETQISPVARPAVVSTHNVKRTSKARYNAIWQVIHRGDYQVVLGTRQAIFMPFKDFDTILIDEADSADHVSWDQKPRFRSVTAVQEIQRLTHCNLALTSLAPQVKDFYLAKEAGYELIDIGQKEWSERYTLVNLRDERRREFTYLSEKLLTAIDLELGAKRRTLLIVNKNGYASQVACNDCGYIAHCERCQGLVDVRSKQLHCVNCGATALLPLVCPKCASSRLKNLGVGIEQIEEKIKELFPEASVTTDLSVPADITLSTVNGELTSVLGNFTLLGVVYADSPMFLPDYTINEELYAHLVNLISNFCDQSGSGQVIVQTAQADNSAIRNLRKPYLDFYREELSARRRYGYPPFTGLIKLFFEHHDEGVALFEADSFYHQINLLCRQYNIEITAPYSYYKKQVRGRYRVQILLKFKPNNIEALEDILMRVPSSWTIDREPVNVL